MKKFLKVNIGVPAQKQDIVAQGWRYRFQLF